MNVKAFIALGVVLLMLAGWAFCGKTLCLGLSALDAESLRPWVDRAGIWGPATIIALMTVAVVASPIPSAPIALAAGAAYGHYAGAVYVAIGSETGALAAFLIARHLGREPVEKLLRGRADYGLLGSQNTLTMVVFVSRLLPFISFDAFSYLAGLSKIHLWRFLLATLAGILPASFLLAHFGAVAISGDIGVAELITVGLGLLTAITLLLPALIHRQSRPLEDDQ